MTKKPPTLFEPPPVDPDTLRDRQRRILQLLQAAGHDGLDTDQAGAVLHADRGKHPPDERCAFCGDDGRQVLLRLAELGLAVKERRGPWRATEHATPTVTGPQPGDLPEDF